MVILVPILLIILVIFTIDMLYYEDLKVSDKSEKNSTKEIDNRKKYMDEYLKP
jgi:uncharacterized membrane protein